jgi:hypothetical protein
MEEKKLSGEESLEIISQMISKAKNDASTENGVGWLLWGWMIFLASVATIVLIELKYHNLGMAWNIFGIIAILLLLYSVFRPVRTARVRTYIDDLLRLFDIGFIVCLFVIIISINVTKNPNAGFGYFLMVYAFLMLIQGGALKFKPLIIGAVVNWIGAIAIFVNEDFKYDMVITAAAVFIGYIIPGFILRAQYKQRLKTGMTDKA